MRHSPANKLIAVAALSAAIALGAFPAQAQQQVTQDSASVAAQREAMANTMAASQAAAAAVQAGMANASNLSSMAARKEKRSFFKQSEGYELTDTQMQALLGDPDTPQAKAEALAAKRKYQRDLEKNLMLDAGDDLNPPPPLDLADLQDMGEGMSFSALSGLDDGMPANPGDDRPEGVGLDLRYDAQKEAALSFGARGGLAKRNFQIMERLTAFEETMDRVFNFRALLVKAPSGLLIEPPMVREAVDSLVVTEGGHEAAVSDRIYDISKQAKIVTAPRDWRQYLMQSWVSRVPNPPKLLWPKDATERARWKRWVAQGWRAGTRQADDMFEANIARLTSDFNGMIRYRTLLSQGMISQPYAMHEDRGVTGSKTVMRIGDRAVRITGPAQFLTTGSDLWKPADR